MIPLEDCLTDDGLIFASDDDARGLVLYPPQWQPGDVLVFCWPKHVELMLPQSDWESLHEIPVWHFDGSDGHASALPRERPRAADVMPRALPSRMTLGSKATTTRASGVIVRLDG